MTHYSFTSTSDTKLDRRSFLGTAFTALSFYIVPRHVLGEPGNTPPSEVITRTVIPTPTAW
jgi:hypothetical protein